MVSVYVAGTSVLYVCEPGIDPSLGAVKLAGVVWSPQSMVTFHGPSWSGSVNDAPFSVNPRPTRTSWSPPALTTGGWFAGAVQVIAKAVEPVPPAGTLAVCELPPVTVQLLATPPSTTVWLPLGRPVKVVLPLIPIDWFVPFAVTV